MSIQYLLQDAPEFISRGRRILSVLNGEGTCETLPSRPDVKFDDISGSALDRFDPDLDFDFNSFSRMDKFDALEVGQEVIDSKLDGSSSSDSNSKSEEK